MGVLIVNLTNLIIPPSIIGLILLWLTLRLKLMKLEYIQDGAGFLIAFLTLFFIPSTVGIVEYPELLTLQGLYLVVAVILSTLLAMFVSGRMCQWIERKEQVKKEEIEGAGNLSNHRHHR